MELCGDGEDIITEYEAIRDDLIAYAYGIWDHIKNNKEGIHEHHAENYALEWVGALPGVRESRRLVGDYMLSETDNFRRCSLLRRMVCGPSCAARTIGFQPASF